MSFRRRCHHSGPPPMNSSEVFPENLGNRVVPVVEDGEAAQGGGEDARPAGASKSAGGDRERRAGASCRHPMSMCCSPRLARAALARTRALASQTLFAPRTRPRAEGSARPHGALRTARMRPERFSWNEVGQFKLQPLSDWSRSAVTRVGWTRRMSSSMIFCCTHMRPERHSTSHSTARRFRRSTRLQRPQNRFDRPNDDLASESHRPS